MKNIRILPGTLVIAVGAYGHSPGCYFGIVERHTAGPNFMVRTKGGSFIFSNDRIIPLVENRIVALGLDEALKEFLPQIRQRLIALNNPAFEQAVA